MFRRGVRQVTWFKVCEGPDNWHVTYLNSIVLSSVQTSFILVPCSQADFKNTVRGHSSQTMCHYIIQYRQLVATNPLSYVSRIISAMSVKSLFHNLKRQDLSVYHH